MRIKVGNKVIIKNRSKIVAKHGEWVKEAIKSKKEFEVKEAIPMKGFYIESSDGVGGVVDGSSLRLINPL